MTGAVLKPLDQWGVRELARATGISPTTATRVKRGETALDGPTMRAVFAATGRCLCCQNTATPDPAAIVRAALEAAAKVAGDAAVEVLLRHLPDATEIAKQAARRQSVAQSIRALAADPEAVKRIIGEARHD